MGNKNQGLGNAANVRQELEKKAAAEAAAKMAKAAAKKVAEEEDLEEAEGDEDAEDDDEKETTKEETKPVVKRTAPVKLTDLLLQVIKSASYIPEEHLSKLVASIEAALEKTGGKPSVKDFVKNLLTNADPKKGISKGAMIRTFTTSEFMKGIDPDSDQFFEKVNAFTTQMNFFVMPSYYKKEGWNLVAIEGGGFAILPKK